MKPAFTDKQIHILTAAEELIAAKGFHGTSVREICAAAGVNVAMISYYFGSKEKMMASLYQFRVQRTLENFATFSEGIDGKSPREQMTALVSFITGHILKFSYFHGFVTQEWQSTPEVRSTLQEFYRSFGNTLSSIVKRGVESGEFKNSPKPESLLATLIGTIIFIIRNRSFYEQFIPEGEDYLAEVEQQLNDHLNQTVFGLLTYRSA